MSVVQAWWLFLCAASAVNVVAWLLSARRVGQHIRAGLAPPSRRWLLALSLVYVLGCAFRSALPRADVQRIALWDTWLSCVGVGRSVATVAELCFVAQWALLLHEAGLAARSSLARGVALLTVPAIAVAELCSWYAVLTTCYLGNVIEQSLWTTTAALHGIAVGSLWPRCAPRGRPAICLSVVAACLFVAFMTSTDIRMYWLRWCEDEASGRAYLGLFDGARDVFGRVVPTWDLAEWREELAWMALYFSVCVWLSIGLAHAPRFEASAPS